MKTVQEYLDLKKELVTLIENWDRAEEMAVSYIRIKMFGNNWRLKKSVGCTKDYDGWTFHSLTTNRGGYELYEAIRDFCADFKDLIVYERLL